MKVDDDFYREFEHTGDLGIEVSGTSRGEMFSHAVIALSRLMVTPDGIAARESRTIDVAPASDCDLMHDLLADALNLFLCDGFIWRDATVTEDERGLHGVLNGEPFDSNRHQLISELKAVTYHQLSVGCVDGAWRARIIFDV